MPSVASILSTYRRIKSPHSSHPETPKNKLKKRRGFVPLGGPEPCELPCSAETEPSRPRASTTAVPDLPSLPIYQTFSSRDQRGFVGDKPRGTDERCKKHRLSRYATIADFHQLSQWTPGTLDSSTTEPTDKPPAYDRAAELGKYYSSILPDFAAFWYEDGSTSGISGVTRSQSTSNPRRQSIRYELTIPPWVSARDPNSQDSSPQRTRPSSHTNPPAATPPSTSSAITAVDVDSHLPPPTQHQQQSQPAQQPPTTIPRQPQSQINESWPLPSPTSSPNTSNPSPNTNQPSQQTRPPRQHSPTTLRLCTNLLIQDLTQAFFEQPDGISDTSGAGPSGVRQGSSTNTSGLSKAQIRLMTEAYGGVLERCRGLRERVGELGVVEAGVAQVGGRNLGRVQREVEGVVEVLEHWVGVLERVYEGECGDDGEDGEHGLDRRRRRT